VEKIEKDKLTREFYEVCGIETSHRFKDLKGEIKRRAASLGKQI
jgi:hypothetical protein